LQGNPVAEHVYDTIRKETDYWIDFSKRWTNNSPEAQKVYDRIRKGQEFWINQSRRRWTAPRPAAPEEEQESTEVQEATESAVLEEILKPDEVAKVFRIEQLNDRYGKDYATRKSQHNNEGLMELADVDIN